MLIGIVKGTVVSNTRNDKLPGARYLLIEKALPDGTTKGEFIVAYDLIGANRDELVYVSESTSARETFETQNKPVDAVIVGIVDLIDIDEKTVYTK
ncbi:MAG: ethanolamine utilization protein EutN [Marinilabiliales bacterium]|nr:MAG: ethanolamine utilization protein EutN [Marinilabiliales bacterium]